MLPSVSRHPAPIARRGRWALLSAVFLLLAVPTLQAGKPSQGALDEPELSPSAVAQEPERPESTPPSPREPSTAIEWTEQERQALQRFLETYVLAPDEDLKRIAEPPPLGRGVHQVQWALQQPGDEKNRQYWERAKREWEEYEEKGMIVASIYQWRDEKPDWLRTLLGHNQGGTPLVDLVPLLTRLSRLEIEGDAELLQTKVEGDFLIRQGMSDEMILERLGEILRRECDLPLALRFRDVERDVLVVRGRYHFQPVFNQTDNRIIVTAHAPDDPDDFKSFTLSIGRTQLDQLFNELSMHLGQRIFAHVEGAPDDVRWKWRPYEDDLKGEKHLVLQNLSEQTGLTINEERQRVRVLFIELAN